MEKELSGLMKEVLKDEFYVSKIKQALQEKIISSIQYDFNKTIADAIKEFFTDGYTKELSDIISKEKDNLKKIMKDKVKELILDLSNKVELKLSSWEVEKIFKDAITVNRN